MSFSTEDVIQSMFGVKTRPRTNDLVSEVGTTATRIMRNDPKRMSFLILNLSANTIYIHIRENVSSDEGILLSPNGGNISMSFDKDLQLVTYEFFAISTAASSKIIVFENLIYKGFN